MCKKRLYKFILILFILCFNLNSLAQEIDYSEYDTSGPPFNPAQAKILEKLKDYQECSFIDWKGGTGADRNQIEIIHNFDRPQDKNGTYQIINFSEDLSEDWNIEEAWFETKSTGPRKVSDWSSVTTNLKFISPSTKDSLVSLGYLIQVPPKTRVDEKLEDVPNYHNMYYLPTSCGTLLFVRYIPKCDLEESSSYAGSSAVGLHKKVRFKSTDNTTSDKKENSYDTGQELYYLAQVYPPTYSRDSIAEEFFRKRFQHYKENYLALLETTQSVLEIYPFVSSARAIIQTVDTGEWEHGWEHKPLITATDYSRLAADLILDAIPFLAQSRKMRRASKEMFIAGSTASLETNNIIEPEDKLKMEDIARLISLGIVIRDFRALPIADKISDSKNMIRTIALGESPASKGGTVVYDPETLESLFKAELGSLNKKTRESRSYNLQVRKYLEKLYSPVFLKTNLKFAEETDTLIKFLKLDQLDKSIRETIIENYKRNREALNSITESLIKASQKIGRARLSNEPFHALIEANFKLDRFLGDLIKRQGKKLELTSIPESKYPIDEIIEAARSARDKANTLGITDPIELERKTVQLTMDSIRRNYGLAGYKAFYRPSQSSKSAIYIFQHKIPGYYYEAVDELGRRSFKAFEAPKGESWPFFGPNGEVVKPLTELTQDSEVGVFFNIGHYASYHYNLLIKQEELTHAAAHLQDIVGPTLKKGSRDINISGTGYLHVQTAAPVDADLINVAYVPFNISTVNCIEWIKRLSPEEFFELYKKFYKPEYPAHFPIDIHHVTQMREDAMDAAEMDIFFQSFPSSGERLIGRDENAAYVLNVSQDYAYMSRKFAEEYSKRPESRIE